MASGPQVGAPAPDFEVDGTEGRFRLSAYRGSPVVLLFYPRDESLVCRRQFCSYRDRSDELAALDAVVVGISPQDVETHARFRANHRLTVPLLADVDRAVASRYGLAGPLWRAARATIVIDAEGIVRRRAVHVMGIGFDDVDALRDAITALPATKAPLPDASRPR